VRRELARRREAEAVEQRRAEEARFAGGPCWACGATRSAVEEQHPDGRVVKRPDWHPHHRGVECTWCVEWRGGDYDDGLLLDRAAAILRDEHRVALVVEAESENAVRATLERDPWSETHLRIETRSIHGRSMDDPARWAAAMTPLVLQTHVGP